MGCNMVRKKGISTNTLVLAMSLLVIKVLYALIIDKMLPYDYMLWTYNKDVDLWKMLVELFPFFLSEYFVLRRYEQGDAYSFFTILLFIVSFIPANSGLSLSNNEYEYYALNNIYYIVLFFTMSVLRPKEFEQEEGDFFTQLADNKRYTTVIRAFMILVCIISLVRTYLYNGLNLTFIFSDMYSVRADYANYYASLTGSSTAYILLLVTNLGAWFLPIYLYYAIVNNKILDIGLSLLSIVAVFTIEMMKTNLLLIPIVVYFAILKKRDTLNKVTEKTIRAIILLFIASFIEYGIRGSSWLFDVVIRRLFYVPMYMVNVHYGYFSMHDKILFTNDAFFIQYIGRLLFGTRYPYTAVRVISENCFRGLLPSPNTGMFAEAYAQLGVAGVLVFPFIVVLVAKLIRKYSQSYGDGAVLVALSYLVIKMISGYILASSIFVGIIEFVAFSMAFRYFQARKAVKEKQST